MPDESARLDVDSLRAVLETAQLRITEALASIGGPSGAARAGRPQPEPALWDNNSSCNSGCTCKAQ